jgi:hypothetical protein
MLSRIQFLVLKNLTLLPFRGLLSPPFKISTAGCPPARSQLSDEPPPGQIRAQQVGLWIPPSLDTPYYIDKTIHENKNVGTFQEFFVLPWRSSSSSLFGQNSHPICIGDKRMNNAFAVEYDCLAYFRIFYLVLNLCKNFLIDCSTYNL